MGNDELKILIEAALDLEKSFQNMVVDMNKLRERMKTYQIKVLAGLDKSASAAQIKSDLAQLNKAKNRVNLVGQMDREATKKNVNSTLKKLKDSEIKITGVLDGSATASNIKKSLQSVPDVTAKADVEVKGTEQVDNLRRKMDGAGDSATGMAAKLYLARTALQMLRRTVREAISTVQELDEAATSLALATGSGSDEAYKLLSEYNDMAKRLGATTTQVSDAATEWLRQGKSAAETSTLIEQSMVLSKVGAMDADEATKNLTSAMKGYGLAVKDVSGIVDKLTAIDLRAAVTSSDLAVAMSRTANSANISGVSMDRLLGYLATVEEVTQKSAETIGESFKTIFSRMGNVKLGKFLDDDGEDLSDVEKILNSFGIALRENNNQFRDFGAVLDEIAGRWSDFTNVEQNAIATTIAGTRQRENFLVLMENYGAAIEYAGVAADSAGTAMEKFAAYEDSIEAKAALFVAAMESLTMDTIDSGLVKDLISASTALVEFVEKAGLLRATLLSLGAGATLKGVKLIATGFKNVSQHVLNMGEAVNILRRVGDVSALSGEQIKRLGTLTKGLSDSQLKLILSSQNLSTAQMKAILQASGLTSAEAAQKLQTLGLATAQQTTAGATWSLTAALNGLKVAIMSNPIGALMTAVAAATVVFSLISNAIEDAKQKEEEARQKMLEVADAAKEEADAISDLYDTYTQANKAYQDGVGSKDDLTSATDNLLDALGYEKGAVADLVKEYGSLEKAIDGVTKKALEQKAASILEGFNAAKENALSAAEDSMGWFSGSAITVKTNGDDKKFAELLQKAGYLGNGDLPLLSTTLYTGINNYGDIDSLIEGYEKLLEIKKLLESGIGNGYSAKELSDAGVYTDVIAKINAVSEEIEAYKDIIRAYDEAQAQIAYMDFAEANGVPETRDEYDALKQSLLDAADASGKYIGSQEEIEAAITNMLATKPALQEFFAASTEATEGISLYKAQLSELTDVISALQSSYNALGAAQSDMADGGGLSPETIEKLAKAEANYLDYLYEENGVVKLNTEAWKENANAKMLGEMDEIQKEIDSLNEQSDALAKTLDIYYQNRHMSAGNSVATEAWDEKIQELTADIAENNRKIEENQAKLALYGSIYGDITGDMDAYRSALANFSNVASTIDTISGSFQTLANLQAEVANGFTMSLDKALEFAKVYPEILNSAQATADGQISLNEDVVNSFIEGKKAELDAQLDAQIATLESDKAKLEARLAFSQAELELAKNVGEGESQIAKEVAEFRLDTANQLVAALIDAGIDEATAFQLACEAMAGNAEEFDRIAMEVCTDVNGNFNQAAYEAAQAIYQNMNSAKKDVASLATQAQQTAEAIAGMADGVKKGSAAIVSGSGGGTQGSGITLNLTGADFKGTDYTYEAKSLSLDDFISDLELDISNYQDAISHINGQIAALQALKNTPLKSFKGSGTGSGGSSPSSTKEVEEYIASIDEYRDAVERLRKAQEEADKLETAIDNAGSFEKKIELQEKLIAAYREEQAALHNLNDMRDSTITQGVELLRELGFAVQYNADTNELWIENLEHLNELTADSAGEYGSLQEATNALREGTEDLINTITDLNDANREGSESWWELNRSIIETTVSMYENMMQARKNAAMLAENGMDNAIDTKNLDDVKKFSAAMIAEYQGMQKILHQEAEYYRSLGYSDTSDEVSKLSDLWWDYADNIKSVKEQVVDYLIDIVDAASDSVDEIRNVSDVLHDATDEFAANDGFITIDTWNALRKVGTQYMQMLVDENGVYQINEERINAVIAARTRQLAVENAMSYVERLKLAAQEGSIEDLNNLIFATTDATNSTWGLVYAELELMHTMGDLNDSQYQAALHNIQVMQDLAENAIQNIGKATDSVAKNLEETRKQLEATKKGLQDTLDELEDMQDGAGDLVDYVMDMLKHRIQQQINLLGEMKDKYSEIIDLKKKSLDATKDEQDYQKTIAKKLKEMAKLQDRINALSLDDSRSAQAERAKLLEQMAELQENLADTQADKSIEAQKEALDKMEEDYHAEKDEEIKILEDSISSTQKLWDMAISYIQSNWGTLFQELIQWNHEAGTSLDTEITAAWEAAQAAAQRYGDFVGAIMGGISAEIDSITKQIEALDEQMSNLSTSSGSPGTGGAGTDNRNTTVGNKVTHTSPTSEDMVRTIVGRMKEYGAAWNRNNDKATNDALHQKAADLAKQLDQYGVHAEFRDSDGTWWITQDKLNPSNIGKLLHNCYHTGGFVGDEPLKPNERYIKAENGELVLTSDQQDSFAAQIDRIGAMTEKFMGTSLSMAQPILPDFSHLGGGTINNVTNSSSQPVTINQGDVIIQGAVMSPKQLAENINPYIDVTRNMANQLSRMLRGGGMFSNRGGLDNSMWK